MSRSTFSKFLALWGLVLYDRVSRVSGSIQETIALMNPFINPSDREQVRDFIRRFEERGWEISDLRLYDLYLTKVELLVFEFSPEEDLDEVIRHLHEVHTRYREQNIQSGHFNWLGFLPDPGDNLGLDPEPPYSWQTRRRTGPESLENPQNRYRGEGGRHPRPIDYDPICDHEHGH